MSHRFRWFEEDRVCLVRYEGEMDAEAFIEADREIFAAVRGQGIRFLFDMRDVRITGGAATARRYAEWISESDMSRTHPAARQVIIADTPGETGLSMLMNSASDAQFDFRIFSTVEAACEALGVSLELVARNTDLIPV